MRGRNSEALAARGRKIYNDRLRQALEKSAYGLFVAIEVDSGNYFLGSTPLESIERGKQRYPDKVFHLIRVGYKTAFML